MAVLGIVFSGCLLRPSPQKVVTRAPDTLLEQKSARVYLTTAFSGTLPQGPFEFEVTGDGQFDFEGQRGRMSMGFLSGDKTVGPKQVALFDPAYIYLVSPPCPSGALGGKPWFRYDYKKAAGVDPGSAASTNPTDFLQALRGASSVQEAGEDRIRGVSTSHYRVTIDVAKALDRLTAERREQSRALLESMGARPKADVWVDGRRLPRKFSLFFNASNESGSFDVKLTLEFFSFGEKVEADIPSQDQFVTVEDPQSVQRTCAGAQRTPTPGY